MPTRIVWGWQHPMNKFRYDVESHDPLTAQLDHFCRVVRGEEKPMVTARDGARSLALVLAVMDSIRLRAPVQLPQS